MFKALINFVFLTAIIWVGIDIFRHFTGKEKWAVTKTVAYSVFCAIISIILLFAVVYFF